MAEGTCSIEGCDEPRSKRGFCGSHYSRWHRHGEQMSREPIRYPQSRLCCVVDCLKPVEGHGYCVKHLRRMQAHGDAETTLVERDAVKRFHESYRRSPAGCWIWTGSDRNQFGHARMHDSGRRVLAHRWSYEHFIGPIPKGLVLDHLCKNAACVNPTHLEPVTQPENVARAETAITTINRNKTHCIHGHEFNDKNTARRLNGDRPRRACRACAREREATRRYNKRRAAMR
jgi:hypothetical protein